MRRIFSWRWLFRPLFNLRYSLLLPVLVVLLLASCDNSIDPVSKNSTSFFSVYGYLDTAADTQFVRIAPLRATVQNPSLPSKLGASVTIAEANSSRQFALRDSVIKLTDGSYGHLYYALFKPLTGTTYTLNVVKDQAETTATTTVPPPPTFTLTDAVPESSTNRYSQQITLKSLSTSPSEATVRYYAAIDTLLKPIEFSFSYGIYGAFDSKSLSWSSPVFLENDLNILKTRMESGKPASLPIYFMGISFFFERVDEMWQERIKNPTKNLSNVQHGVGFWGATARFRQNWKLPLALLNKYNLRNKQR